MYQSLYSEMAAETTSAIRDHERQAFERSIALLRSAQIKGRGSRESVCAESGFGIEKPGGLFDISGERHVDALPAPPDPDLDHIAQPVLVHK